MSESDSKSSRLKKSLGSFEVFSVAAGSMISSGLFVLPAIAFTQSKAGILIAYGLAGIFMLPALFSKLELATALPKAGGTYFYSVKILGPMAGLLDGFANWISISLKSAFALAGIGAFVSLIYPNISLWEIKLYASLACIFFMVLNLFGAKHAGTFQTIFVVILIAILLQFIIVGYRSMTFEPFDTLSQISFLSILPTTALVFISFGGLTKVASLAEEIKDPGKNLVRGTLSAFLVVEALYLLVIFVLIGTIPEDLFAGSLTPVTDATSHFNIAPEFQSFQFYATAIAGLIAFITTANAGIMAASRNPLAMSRDGLLPSQVGTLVGKQKAPGFSIVVTSCLMIFIIVALDIKELAKVASLFMLLLFIMVNLSVIIARSSKVKNYRPSFKSPLFPFTQILGIGIYGTLIFSMGLDIFLIALGFIVIGLFWYFLYARKHVAETASFVSMVKSATATEIAPDKNKLENELLEILMDRDDIVEDRFDGIIRQSLVIDLDKTMSRSEMFHLVSLEIAKKLSLDSEMLERKLNHREDEASTLIYPGIAVPHAIPHVVIEGEHLFDIVLVRNRFGIVWNDAGEIVYTAFCLIGSKDERTFHLQALMAIAHILQDPNFEKNWHKASNAEQLRASVLLSKRKRGHPN